MLVEKYQRKIEHVSKSVDIMSILFQYSLFSMVSEFMQVYVQ